MQSQMMLSFHLAILSGCLVSAAVLQLPQTLNPEAQAPSNDLLTEWLQSNGSLSSIFSPSISHEEWNTTLSAGSNEPRRVKINCDGVQWDYDLDMKSCFSAYESMQRAAGPEKTFGARNADGQFDDKLPIRYLSSDGTCAIEPFLLPGRGSAKVKDANVAIAALTVIEKCMNKKRSTGGMIWDFGGDNGLALKVSRFRPEVKCYGSIPKDKKILGACQGLAEKMSTSTKAQTFGHKGSDSSGLDPDVILPILTRSKDGLCTMSISSNDHTQSDWSVKERFWDAAVAINAMCIRNGQSGYWDDIGIKGRLEIHVIGGTMGGATPGIAIV